MAVHAEWIHARSFDEKFKNALRDYFQYGFKTLDSYPGEDPKTMREDWKRLNNILGDFLEWSEEPRRILFATMNSQSAEMNVFQRVYRFCGFLEKDPVYFLHVLSALCPNIFLRDGLEGLELEKQDRLVRSGRKKEARKLEPCGKDEEFVLQLTEDLEKGEGLSTAELMCFYPDGMPLFSGENRKTNIRLQKLADLGLLRCSQQVEKGNRCWELSRDTLSRLLEAGRQANGDFLEHFQLALDFYARYLPLGELGLFLLDRLGVDLESPFRFQHEYYAHALQDFNLVDLFCAMDEGLWCLIRYRHGVTEREAEVLCFPMEIRISTVNGRESLMYYEPFLRSYSSLRLEFMDSIQYLSEEKVMEILHVSSELLKGDIAYARKALTHTWGLSTTPEQRGNAVPRPQKAVRRVLLRVTYDPATEAYIPMRMAKGRRVGTVKHTGPEGELVFTAEVTDTSELRPWVRSFYGRLSAWEGMEARNFSVEQDVQDMAESLARGKLLSRRREYGGSWFPYGIPVLYADPLRREAVPAREHEKIFHEIFSACYHVMAWVFTQLCGEKKAVVGAEEVQGMIRESLGAYCHMIGMRTEEFIPRQLQRMLLAHGFATPATVTGGGQKIRSVFAETRPAYRLRYGSRETLDFYRDVVPLTQMEMRWLRTMLEDRWIGYFLAPEERQALLQALMEGEAIPVPLPMNRVKYFDQNRFPKEQRKGEARAVRGLLEAITRRRVVHLQYLSVKEKRISGRFCPVLLMFSKRDNRFQGYLQSCQNQRIYILNLSRIQSVALTEECFDYSAAKEALDQYQAEQERSVEVEFFNVRDLAERLLTEFSPWKKRCVYERSTGLYRLTLFYQKQEEADLVVRLMGYGPDLRITDSGHPIRQAVEERVRRQMDRMRQCQKARGRPRKHRQTEPETDVQRE